MPGCRSGACQPKLAGHRASLLYDLSVTRHRTVLRLYSAFSTSCKDIQFAQFSQLKSDPCCGLSSEPAPYRQMNECSILFVPNICSCIAAMSYLLVCYDGPLGRHAVCPRSWKHYVPTMHLQKGTTAVPGNYVQVRTTVNLTRVKHKDVEHSVLGRYQMPRAAYVKVPLSNGVCIHAGISYPVSLPTPKSKARVLKKVVHQSVCCPLVKSAARNRKASSLLRDFVV